MCVHCCLFPHTYMMHDVYKCMQVVCSCMCVCVWKSPGEKPCLKLCVTASHPARSRPVSHATQPQPHPFCSSSSSSSFLPFLSLHPTSLLPCCSLKQAAALISQKNNWEVCLLQYAGPPLRPSGSLQQCQLPLGGTPGARAKSNYLYHRLFFSVCLPFSFFTF